MAYLLYLIVFDCDTVSLFLDSFPVSVIFIVKTEPGVFRYTIWLLLLLVFLNFYNRAAIFVLGFTVSFLYSLFQNSIIMILQVFAHAGFSFLHTHREWDMALIHLPLSTITVQKKPGNYL